MIRFLYILATTLISFTGVVCLSAFLQLSSLSFFLLSLLLGGILGLIFE